MARKRKCSNLVSSKRRAVSFQGQEVKVKVTGSHRKKFIIPYKMVDITVHTELWYNRTSSYHIGPSTLQKKR